MVVPAPDVALRAGVALRGQVRPPPKGNPGRLAQSQFKGPPEALSTASSTVSMGMVVGATIGGLTARQPSQTAPSPQMKASALLAPTAQVWRPELAWDSLHAGFGVAAVCLGALECVRFVAHQPPSQAEAVVALLLHLGLCMTRMDALHKIPYHWQVTFYASLGWNFWAATSLLDVMFPKMPMLQCLEFVGGIVLIAASVYFYTYQWGRIVRHVQQNRLNPFYPVALFGLMACHAMDVGEFSLAHWFGTQITGGPAWRDQNFAMWQDQWWFIADVRLIELLATSVALFGIILAASGKFDGKRNAYATIGGTVVLPMVILFTTHWKLAASFHAWGSPYFLR